VIKKWAAFLALALASAALVLYAIVDSSFRLKSEKLDRSIHQFLGSVFEELRQDANGTIDHEELETKIIDGFGDVDSFSLFLKPEYVHLTAHPVSLGKAKLLAVVAIPGRETIGLWADGRVGGIPNSELDRWQHVRGVGVRPQD
jgi:hypothetical protein